MVRLAPPRHDNVGASSSRATAGTGPQLSEVEHPPAARLILRIASSLAARACARTNMSPVAREGDLLRVCSQPSLHTLSGARASDGQAVHAQGGLSDPYWNALPLFAAGADSRV
jgi:hypothetical protein